MKRHIRLLSYTVTFLVLSAPLITLAQDVKRTRLINKSYDVKADDKLWIENQFGNVVVSTWDKEQITVDIEIGARASTDEKADEIMKKIDVRDSVGGHEIRFKTKVDEIHNNKNNWGHNWGNKNGDGDQRGFYIDYIIHMPENNRLDIDNSFGKTEVPAFKGGIALTSKFGSLNTGKLENVDMINVEFGKCYITSMNNGKVTLKFDQEARLGQVGGTVKITSEFSQNVRIGIANDIKDLSLFESYSGIRMVVDKDLSAEFDVHTSFGHFHNESDFSIEEEKEDASDYGPHFDKDYSGKAGEGKARIKVKSSFGTVRLSYAGERERDDDKDNDKDKHKHGNKDKDKDDEGDKNNDTADQ
jgi:hypothetical protein